MRHMCSSDCESVEMLFITCLNFVFVRVRDICSERWATTEQSTQYTFALLTLQFALPLGALICTYARIAYLVWGVRPPGEAECMRDKRIQDSKRKVSFLKKIGRKLVTIRLFLLVINIVTAR